MDTITSGSARKRYDFSLFRTKHNGLAQDIFNRLRDSLYGSKNPQYFENHVRAIQKLEKK